VKYSTVELIARWEGQRDIKNLMGKYANCIILNREGEIFGLFWSKTREDICLAFNDGYYKGRGDVEAYYKSVYERNALVSRLLRDRFPDQLGGMSDEAVYGIGPFKVKPLACPVIEIAEDGKTAKGLWYCQGAYSEVGSSGPVAFWTWGFCAVDFVREDREWKIWHLMYVNDVDSICGQSWGKPQKPYAELPEFAALKDFKYAEYTQKMEIRPYYRTDRPLVPVPRIPEPYDTFENTFSYGF
jgi:hypothetical protein